jgi:hypothetical protein
MGKPKQRARKQPRGRGKIRVQSPLSIRESVLVPVTCPKCRQVSTCQYPLLVILAALTTWHSMNLYVPCHRGSWDATEADLSAIQEYLGEAWIRTQSARRRAVARGSRGDR